MTSTPSALFIFSLPRSGSTLTQRMLAAHEGVATASEPWFLLPYLYTLPEQARGVYADYEHHLAVQAIEDFGDTMPQGREDCLHELRNLSLRLYAKASNKKGARYFLGKTPPYSLIVEDVMRLFPDGKFVFLWRNPLAVIASLLEAPWPGEAGAWSLHYYETQLFEGLERLLEAYRRRGDASWSVRYEDLVRDPRRELNGVFEYLGLPFDSSVADRFGSVELSGRLGDDIGTRSYSRVSTEPLRKWKQVLNNPVRKAWRRRYLRWIGAERLALMGYKLEGLMEELDAVPTSPRRVASDARNMAYGQVRSCHRALVFKDRRYARFAWLRGTP